MLTAKAMSMDPEILLMILILYGLSLCLILAAINTFITSATMLMPKQTPNKTILSKTVWFDANAVVLISQKKITLGFNVLITKPAANAFVKSLLPKSITAALLVSTFIFLKNT